MKIYGLQRSGTNYLKFLLESNFKNVVVIDLPLGNKHEAAAPHWHSMKNASLPLSDPAHCSAELRSSLERGEVRFAFISKPLLPWLSSFRRYRELKSKQSVEWTESFVERAVNLWVNRTVEWLDWIPKCTGKFNWMLYDDLVRDKVLSLQTIEGDLEIGELNRVLELAESTKMRRGTDQQHAQNLVNNGVPFDQGEYLKKSEVTSIPDWAAQLALTMFVSQGCTETPELRLL